MQLRASHLPVPATSKRDGAGGEGDRWGHRSDPISTTVERGGIAPGCENFQNSTISRIYTPRVRKKSSIDESPQDLCQIFPTTFWSFSEANTILLSENRT